MRNAKLKMRKDQNNNRKAERHLAFVFFLFNFAFLIPHSAAAFLISHSAAAQREDVAEVDPIRCWWRTSDGAVAIGQPFTLTLTCAVVETDAVRVVPDQAPLEIGTVQLAPFELIGGSHPNDLRSGARRFFQYHYNLRVIDATAIDRDIKLPDLSIHYRVESRVQADSLEGRDRIYLLPPQSVHVTSLVPADATDIRDGSNVPFDDIDALRFRARAFSLGAVALAALGVVALIPAVLRIARGARYVRTSDTATVSDRAILGAVANELAQIQTAAQGGWSADLGSRAATALRIAAGYALGRPPRQRALDGAVSADGRLVVTRRGLKTRKIAVTSPVTSQDVADALEKLPLTTAHERRTALEDIRHALAALTRSMYGPDEKPRDVDEAVAAGARATEYLRRRRI
jgi:hypothetical protein